MSVLGAAGATACSLVLGAAALGHLRDPGALRRAVAAHGVLPDRSLRGARVLVLPVLEAGLALTLAVALLTGAPGLGRWTAAGALLLFAAFAAYLALVLRRTAGATALPCGCGLGEAPLTGWAVARAGVLTVLAGMASLAGIPPGTGSLDPTVPVWPQLLVIVAAGVSLALGAALLPAARAVPEALQVLPGRVR